MVALRLADGIRARYSKSKELGWFKHESTTIAIAPPGIPLHERITPGLRIRLSQAMLRLTNG